MLNFPLTFVFMSVVSVSLRYRDNDSDCKGRKQGYDSKRKSAASTDNTSKLK